MILPKPLALIYIHFLDNSYLKRYSSSNSESDYLDYIKETISKTFHASWSQGGTYGSCWDDELTEVAEEHEPDLEGLNNFLVQYFPDLPSDDYYEIKSCIHYDSSSDSDYYGGCTYTGHKSVGLEDIADVLTELLYKEETDIIDFDDLVLEHSKIVPQLDINSYYKIDLYKDLKEGLEEKNERKKMKI